MIAGVIAAVYMTAVTIFGQEIEMQKVRCTCYLPTGHCTASGVIPYEGIIASNREHLGQMCMIFTMDGELIDIMECRDVGGHRKLRNGTATDVYPVYRSNIAVGHNDGTAVDIDASAVC